MTNTLHRMGSSESLARDFVMLAMATQGVNERGAAPKLMRIAEIVASHSPANIGDEGLGGVFTGVPLDEILASMRDGSYVGAVFVEAERLVETLKELRAADAGMSVVVSAPFHQLFDVAESAGLTAHTVHMSLGFFGRRELLPPEWVLEVTTMCGHGMVCQKLVQKMASRVAEGKTSPIDAGKKLAGTCTCGIFNPVRAAEILERELGRSTGVASPLVGDGFTAVGLTTSRTSPDATGDVAGHRDLPYETGEGEGTQSSEFSEGGGR